jgi:hypothetical protein
MRQFGELLHVNGMADAIKLAFSAWVGFTAPVLLSTVLWEYRPIDLYTITAFYWLVSFLAIAIILFF